VNGVSVSPQLVGERLRHRDWPLRPCLSVADGQPADRQSRTRLRFRLRRKRKAFPDPLRLTSLTRKLVRVPLE
jgi:hypothetical protein